MQASKPSQKTWFIILISSSMAMIAPFSMDIYFASLPSIRNEFGLSESYLQLSVSIYLWSYGFSQLFMGILSDRFGRRPTFAGGMILFIVASLGCALAPSYEVFLIFRFLQAMGACVGAVTSLAIARDLFEGEKRARVISYVSTVMAVAPILAPMLGGVFEEYLNWHASFFFLSTFGALMLFWLFALRETNPYREPVSISSVFRDYFRILTHREWILSASLSTLHFSAFFVWLAASSIYYIDRLGLSPIQFSFAFGGTAFGFMLGAFTNTQALKRYAVPTVILIGTCFLSLGAIGFLFCSFVEIGLWQLWTSGTLCAFGLGFVMPTAFSTAMGPFPQMAGKASALLNVLRVGTGGVVVAVSSAFYDERALGISLVTVSLCVIQIFVCYLLIKGKALRSS